MFLWLKKIIFREQKPLKKVEIPQPKRRKVDTESIRQRIKAQNWNLLEIPVKSRDNVTKETVVRQWRIIAANNKRSMEATGSTIDEAMKNIGILLGVISKEQK